MRGLKGARPRVIKVLIILLACLFLTEAAGFYIAGRGRRNTSGPRAATPSKAQNAALKKKIADLSPGGIHIVIDTGKNRLLLKNGKRTLREAVISSGSGSILKDPSGKRQWVFDTPRGVYTVKTKFVHPNWIKPDWAFIEEGENIPKGIAGRVEEGVLGDYALGFGNGYFIHGTLYTRLLGRNVTHGCIRVGDEDLKAVFNAAPVGAEVLIF